MDWMKRKSYELLQLGRDAKYIAQCFNKKDRQRIIEKMKTIDKEFHELLYDKLISLRENRDDSFLIKHFSLLPTEKLVFSWELKRVKKQKKVHDIVYYPTNPVPVENFYANNTNPTDETKVHQPTFSQPNISHFGTQQPKQSLNYLNSSNQCYEECGECGKLMSHCICCLDCKQYPCICQWEEDDDIKKEEERKKRLEEEEQEAHRRHLEDVEFKAAHYRKTGHYRFEIDKLDDELGRTEYERERNDEKYEDSCNGCGRPISRCECCPRCESSPCECCRECGNHPCECCQRCKSHPCDCCPRCESSPCECCRECGNHPCECCPRCESSPCECCSRCESSPCECCSECGTHPCRCCSRCESDPCECCSECGTHPCECCSYCNRSSCICD